MVVAGRLWMLLFLYALARLAHSQAGGSNVPSSPMWPIFSQLLSTQTGRTLQDINLLGLSDPTIKQLWTSYSAALQTMAPAPSPVQETTPPPLPDLYQTSYSFSSGGSNSGVASPAAVKPAAPASSTANNVDVSQMYNQITSLINQLSGSGGSSNSVAQSTSTSTQDVMNAYNQLAGSMSGTAASSNTIQAIMQQMGTSSPNAAGVDYQALLQKYAASLGGGSAGTSNSGSSSSSSGPSYQALVDQYNSIMKQGGSGSSSATGSYEQLLQQYNQIMGGKPTGTATASKGNSGGTLQEQYAALMTKGGSGSSGNEQVLQMLSQLMNGQGSASPSTPATTTPIPTTPSPQEVFEKQLAILFPQFNGATPPQAAENTSAPASAAASSAGSSTSPGASSNAVQNIFDTLLFGSPPAATTAEPAAGGSGSAPPSPLASIQKLMNSQAGSQAILNDHVQNVFKTRASREMGCRFLPELLELDVLPTAPINCMNRCPFPYVNSQQFGIYCVCCPPGVNAQNVGVMSMMKGASYLETPLAVVT